MTPVASSAVQAPVGIVLTNDIEQLVCTYAWPCLEALNVMWAESGGRPDAASPAGYYGLYQLHPMHGGPEFWSNWMVPEYNIGIAVGLWTASGGSFCPHWPWTC